MTKLTNFVEKIGAKNFEVANDKIKQTDRNNLKKEFLDTLLEVLTDNGLTVNRTNDGIVLTVESKNDTVYITIDGVVKNLDYDLNFEIDEYELKIEKQAERERERIAKREKNSK